MQPGDLCRLYRNTATDATPTWVEIDKAKDVAFPFSIGESDSSARDCEFKLSEANLIGVELTFGYQYVLGADTVYDALVAAMVARTKIQYAAADGPIATVGTRYLKFGAQIFGMDNDEPLEGGKVSGFTLKPTRMIEASAILKPTFVTVDE